MLAKPAQGQADVRPSLPVVSTLRSAVAEIWRCRLELAQAMIFPACIWAVTLGLGYQTFSAHRDDGLATNSVRWFVFNFLVQVPVGAFVSALVAVSCHRIVLVGRDALPDEWGLYWTAREFRFLGRMLVLALIAVPVYAVAFYLLWNLRIDPALHRYWKLALSVPLAYPIARLSLILPAMATDHPITFAESWRASSGNGWRIAAVLAAGPLVMTGLQYALGALSIPAHPVTVGIRSLFFTLLGAFEIVTLSICFRTLRQR